MTDYGKRDREALIEGDSPATESVLDIFAAVVLFAAIFIVLGFVGGVVAAATYLL